MVMKQKLEKALDWRNLGVDVGAVVDTSYLVDRATETLWTLPVALFLRGRFSVTSSDIEREYRHHYETKALDSEGVPKAPIPFEKMGLDKVVAFADSEKVELPESVIAHKQMAMPDKGVIRDAVYFAQETGKEVCLVTNDTAIIRSVRSDLSMENIYLLMPSVAEEHLSDLIHELEFQVLIKGKVLAQLYQLGKAGIEEGRMHYVVVERNQEFRYGKEVLNIDIATDVAFVEGGKSIPATTKSYGMPIVTISSDNKEEIDDAFTSIVPYLRGKKKLWGVLNQEYSFMPAIYRAEINPEIVKTRLGKLEDEIKDVKGVPKSLINKRRRELKRFLTSANLIRWARI